MIFMIFSTTGIAAGLTLPTTMLMEFVRTNMLCVHLNHNEQFNYGQERHAETID